MQITIKRLDGSYAQKTAEIEAICFPAAEAAGFDAFEERFISPAYRCYGAFDVSGTMVGFVNGALYSRPDLPDELYHNVAKLDANGAWQTIFGLDVLPAYRRQGIGTHLMRYMIEESRKQNKKGLVLTCKDYLRPLYEGVGFVWQGVSASTHGNAAWNDMLLEF